MRPQKFDCLGEIVGAEASRMGSLGVEETLEKRPSNTQGFKTQVYSSGNRTPLVWSLKTKDLEGGFGQIFEE
jgi:hypothetical protein